jgi:hypothetical protein
MTMEKRQVETGTIPGTPEHHEAITQLLAGLRVGEQNRGLLGRLTIDGVPAREVCEAILEDVAAPTGARIRCFLALRRLDDPATRPVLLRRLADPDREVVDRVTQCLAEDLPDLAWIEPLREHLRARVPHADRLAWALGQLAAEEAVDDILAFAATGEAERAAAVAALRRLLRRDLGDTLEAYRRHRDQVAATSAAARAEADLQHPDPEVRRWALEDLALRGSRAAVAPLATAAEQDRRTRHWAGGMVLRLLPHLPELARDPACFREGRFYPPGALEALVQLSRQL